MKHCMMRIAILLMPVLFTSCKAAVFPHSDEPAYGPRMIYREILLHPKKYARYYSLTEHIPSSDNRSIISGYDGTQPYSYAILDIDGDGVEELLLGYGKEAFCPWILLNILKYDEEKEKIIDLDGERTYPLMDNLIFHSGGYFSTQNGISDLYTECWNITDNPDHFWYGFERGSGGFLDSDGHSLSLTDYYTMIGEAAISPIWKEATEKNIKSE